MNKNIDLTKILKDCPKGTKLYSTVYGVVRFDEIDKYKTYPISLYTNTACIFNVTSDGRLAKNYNGECTLFPSKHPSLHILFRVVQVKYLPLLRQF